VAAVGGRLVIAPPLAHAGHWLTGLLYLVPLVIVVAMLGVSSLRDRRAEAAEGAAGGSAPPPDADGEA
jgi:cytochrome c-type biogenesis protein CcmH/NrfF